MADGQQRRPTRRGDLEHPQVIRRKMPAIELTIRPDGLQFSAADAIVVLAGLEVDRIADGRKPARLEVWLAMASPRDVKDPLLLSTLLFPDLDHLDAIEIGATRVLHRPNNETGCHSVIVWRGQIPAHGHTLSIGRGNPIRLV